MTNNRFAATSPAIKRGDREDRFTKHLQQAASPAARMLRFQLADYNLTLHAGHGKAFILKETADGRQ
jgi:hypothetical protein